MSDEPDIVADINVWLEHNSLANPYRQMVSRARNEIVALRRQMEHDREYFAKARTNIRAEALEEAAICENLRPFSGSSLACAATIREVKETTDADADLRRDPEAGPV